MRLSLTYDGAVFLKQSLEDTDNLPAPEVLRAEIAENPQSELEQFNSILEELKENKTPPKDLVGFG